MEDKEFGKFYNPVYVELEFPEYEERDKENNGTQIILNNSGRILIHYNEYKEIKENPENYIAETRIYKEKCRDENIRGRRELRILRKKSLKQVGCASEYCFGTTNISGVEYE